MPHLSFPVAEAAIHGALAGDEKENTIRIVMGQTRHRGKPFFIKRVVKASRVKEFPGVGHGLSVKGVFLLLDEAKGVRIDPHGILLRNLFQTFGLGGFQEFGKIEGGGYASGKDAFPGFFMVFCEEFQARLLVDQRK
jgi:hypothetical protein